MGVPQCRSPQVGPLQFRPGGRVVTGRTKSSTRGEREWPPLKISTREVSASKVSAVELGASEVGVSEISLSEIGIIKNRAAEVGTLKIRLSKNDPVEK